MPQGVPPLLEALAAGRDDEVPERARSVPEAEWPNLLDTVRRHGLTPLLGHVLATHPRACPSEVRATLRSHEEHAMLWHRIRMSDLRRIITAIEGAGIPHILMKGAALGLMLYRSPWHRLGGDTDILVPAGRAREAHDLAKEAGFQVTEEWEDAHHLPALQKGSNPPIEIHHESLYVPTPDPGYRLVPVDFQALDAEATSVDAGGFQARVPSSRDALLQLSCNFASHMEESIARPLRWVRDYAELLGPGGVGWSAVDERLRELAPELTDTVLLSLALAQPFLAHLYDAELEERLGQLPPGLSRLARHVSARDMVYEWVTSPFRAWQVLSCLMGPFGATKWSLRKLVVSREHISAQTGIPETALSMRVYPVAFAIHAAYHVGRKDRSDAGSDG
ncbi:MAG: hypothetical protein GF320_23100 [Armatimonadia bacterium]|nr:hypothetical protein [Armatimonadia bacterium]